MEADRPYGTSFPTAMASSRLPQGMTETTGPNISSCAIRIAGATSAKIVGSWKWPRACGPVRGAGPPAARRAPPPRPPRPHSPTPESRAPLPAGPAPHAAIHREVQVGVVHHHDDVLAAHFEVHFLEVWRRTCRDHPSDRRGPGERDHTHVAVRHEGGADLLPAAGHEVDAPGRRTGLLPHAHEVP